MKHIRSSVKGVFLLENNGIPVSTTTDFNEVIKKGSLCIDDTNSKLYIFNGSTWDLISGSGSGTGGSVDISYIRANPTKTTVGGLTQGTIPNYNTIQDALDAMLYPFTPPTISLSASTLHEKGLTINKSMSYSIAINDGIVSNRQILLNNILQSNIVSNNGTYNSTSGLKWSNSPSPSMLYYAHTFNYRVNFSNTTQKNSSIIVEFVAPTYYGVLTLANVNETNVKALTKTIRKKGNDINLVFNPTLKRYVYAYPAIYGNLVSIIDQNGFNVTAGYTKTVTNYTLSDSSIESYNVYVANADTTQTNFKLTFNFS